MPFFDLPSLIQTVGYIGIFLIVFAESGFLIGFFLPGDSLLFTAGFLASQGHLNIETLMLLCFLGAVLGDSFGYYFGKKFGPRVFVRDNSMLFHRDHIQRAERFYRAHGPKTIVLARFLPVIRTFVPILAGVGRMSYPVFITYNIIGGLLWGIGIPALGFYLGNAVPSIDRYLIPMILALIIISFLPTLIHVLSHREHRQRLIAFLKKFWNNPTMPII